jgi:hypothetical protein
MAYEDLWDGIDLKLDNAFFHLSEMGRALEPPQRTQHSVAMQASGAIIGKDWQRPLYAHLDAFLSAARSVGNIIMCSFGADTHPRLKLLEELPAEERDRRKAFHKQFKPYLDTFDERLLSTSRAH